MRKVVFLALPALLAMAATAFAQKVDTSKDRGDTLKVTVSGDIDMDGIFRSSEINDGRNNGVPSGAGGAAHDNSSFTIEGYVRVRLDIELSEKISAVISLSNLVLTDSVSNRFGQDGITTGVVIREASITLHELFDPGVKLTLGVVPVAFDLRGKGQAFFFDPANSHEFARSLGNVTSINTAESGENQPTGLSFVYSRDALTVGVFLLPSIADTGAGPNSHEDAWGVWFFYNVDSIGKGSRFGLIAALVNYDTSTAQFLNTTPPPAFTAAGTFIGSAVVTIGGGLDWHGLTEGLELFAEIYFQFGKAANVTSNGSTAGVSDAKAKGWEFQIGGEYHFPNNDNNIWLGLTFQYFSGGDTTSQLTGGAPDTDQKGMMSYSHLTALKIIQDRWFGFGLDTNYWSIQISGGLAFTVGSGAMKNNLELWAIVGFNKLANDMQLQTSVTPNDTSKNIGHEVDLTARLHVSKQVSFDTGIGALFSADVLQNNGTRDDRTAFLWWFGTDVHF